MAGWSSGTKSCIHCGTPTKSRDKQGQAAHGSCPKAGRQAGLRAGLERIPGTAGVS